MAGFPGPQGNVPPAGYYSQRSGPGGGDPSRMWGPATGIPNGPQGYPNPNMYNQGMPPPQMGTFSGDMNQFQQGPSRPGMGPPPPQGQPGIGPRGPGGFGTQDGMGPRRPGPSGGFGPQDAMSPGGGYPNPNPQEGGMRAPGMPQQGMMPMSSSGYNPVMAQTQGIDTAQGGMYPQGGDMSMAGPMHPHLRNRPQNPQQVADSILQMASSNYNNPSVPIGGAGGPMGGGGGGGGGPRYRQQPSPAMMQQMSPNQYSTPRGMGAPGHFVYPSTPGPMSPAQQGAVPSPASMHSSASLPCSSPGPMRSPVPPGGLNPNPLPSPGGMGLNPVPSPGMGPGPNMGPVRSPGMGPNMGLVPSPGMGPGPNMGPVPSPGMGPGPNMGPVPSPGMGMGQPNPNPSPVSSSQPTAAPSPSPSGIGSAPSQSPARMTPNPSPGLRSPVTPGGSGGVQHPQQPVGSLTPQSQTQGGGGSTAHTPQSLPPSMSPAPTQGPAPGSQGQPSSAASSTGLGATTPTHQMSAPSVAPEGPGYHAGSTPAQCSPGFSTSGVMQYSHPPGPATWGGAMQQHQYPHQMYPQQQHMQQHMQQHQQPGNSSSNSSTPSFLPPTPSPSSFSTNSSTGPNPAPPPVGAGNNPLQSLQKLVMLPESQVVDPKSVVNDACLPSNEGSDGGLTSPGSGGGGGGRNLFEEFRAASGDAFSSGSILESPSQTGVNTAHSEQSLPATRGMDAAILPGNNNVHAFSSDGHQGQPAFSDATENAKFSASDSNATSDSFPVPLDKSVKKRGRRKRKSNGNQAEDAPSSNSALNGCLEGDFVSRDTKSPRKILQTGNSLAAILSDDPENATSSAQRLAGSDSNNQSASGTGNMALLI